MFIFVKQDGKVSCKNKKETLFVTMLVTKTNLKFINKYCKALCEFDSYLLEL